MSEQITAEDHLRSLAWVLTDAVESMLMEKAEMKLSSEPKFELKPVTSFMHRMRVDAMEKFNAPTVFSVISFYADKEDMKKQEHALGTIVVYLEQYYIDKLLKYLEYPELDDEDDEEEVKDSCGAICNLICGYFVKELVGHGFKHLEMTHFTSYINTATDGIEFPSDQTMKYEVSYELRKHKRIVAEIAMGAIPRADEKKHHWFGR